MPMLAELRQRFCPPADDALASDLAGDETLIQDSRGEMKSKQFLEAKFGAALEQGSGVKLPRVAARSPIAPR